LRKVNFDTLGIIEHLEDLIFSINQLLPILKELPDILLSLFLLILLLNLEDPIEHIFFEPTRSDHKAEQIDLDTNFGGIMGVRHFGGEIEFEVGGVVD
jgi:hypothetical protein